VPFSAGARRYHAAGQLQGIYARHSIREDGVLVDPNGIPEPGHHWRGKNWVDQVDEQDSPEYQDAALARLQRKYDHANNVLSTVVAAFVITVLLVLALAVYVFTR